MTSPFLLLGQAVGAAVAVSGFYSLSMTLHFSGMRCRSLEGILCATLSDRKSRQRPRLCRL